MTKLGSLDEKLKECRKLRPTPARFCLVFPPQSSSHTKPQAPLGPLQSLQFMGPRRESGVSSPVSSRDSASLTQSVTRTGFESPKTSDTNLRDLCSDTFRTEDLYTRFSLPQACVRTHQSHISEGRTPCLPTRRLLLVLTNFSAVTFPVE